MMNTQSQFQMVPMMNNGAVPKLEPGKAYSTDELKGMMEKSQNKLIKRHKKYKAALFASLSCAILGAGIINPFAGVTLSALFGTYYFHSGFKVLNSLLQQSKLMSDQMELLTNMEGSEDAMKQLFDQEKKREEDKRQYGPYV